MNPKPWIVSSLSVLGLGLLLNACQPTNPVTPPPPPPPPPANVIEIDNANLKYTPATLTIKLNGAPKTVTIRATPGHPFQIVGTWPMGTVSNPNQDQTVTFSAPGTFKFYCSFHGVPVGTTDVSGMSGTIIVEN